MKRSEAFWVLNGMHDIANEEQKQALDIAQKDIEFVDLMSEEMLVQRWIPVTERLPERNVEVLVYTGTSVFSHRFFATESVIQSGVTHWMPLPEPPKEDAE